MIAFSAKEFQEIDNLQEKITEIQTKLLTVEPYLRATGYYGVKDGKPINPK
jgi:hypothetical protein